MKFTMYKAKFTEPTVRSSGDDLVVIPTKGTVTLQNNMYDFRGVVFCCTDCCTERSLMVQQNERRVFI